MRGKQRLCTIWRENGIFLVLMLGMDGMLGIFLWLAGRPAFFAEAGLAVSVSILLFLTGVWYCWRREERRERAVSEFLETLELSEQMLEEGQFGKREWETLRQIEKTLWQQEEKLKSSRQDKADYETYIESWAHEMKLPLSLMTLMLDNRREEISPLVRNRLEHAGRQMQGYVEQLLYYARLKAVHKDYLFERIIPGDFIREELEDYQALFEEQGIEVELLFPAGAAEVITDKKGLGFILRQIVANSVKYMAEEQEEKRLVFRVWQEKDSTVLSIRDNGIGVKEMELPFLFEKGFTGDTQGDRKQSTGMGLYLVKEMAENLGISLEVRSSYQAGFEVLLYFPRV